MKIKSGYSKHLGKGRGISFFNSLISGDPDAEAYFSKIGLTNSTHKSAVNTFVKVLKANSIWSKIIDLGLFLSGSNTLAEAVIKLKYPIGFETYLNNGSATFTDANYVSNKGIQNTSGNRKLDSQIIPSNHGLSKDNFCIITAVTEDVNNTNLSFMSDNKASGGAAVYFQKSTIGMSGGGQQTLLPQNAGKPYIHAITSNGQVRHVKDFRTHFLPTTVANVTLDTSISLFRGRNFGSDTAGATVSIAVNILSNHLTVDEVYIANQAVRSLLVALGRSSTTKECVIYGDSNTVGGVLGSGNGPTLINNRWAYNLSIDLGLKEANLGVGGSVYRFNGTSIPGGYDNRHEILKYDILSGGMVIIAYGTNDCTNDAGSGSNYNDFESKLTTHVNELIAHGMALDKIVIVSIPPIGGVVHSATKQENYRNAAFNAATTTGVIFADLYNYLLSNGGAAANVGHDNLHLNDTGHSNAKNCIAAAIAAA